MPEQQTRSNERALAVAAPRIPYVADAARFGFNEDLWRVLTDAIFPTAQSPASIILALAYCKKRGLDVLKKPVHIVPIWDSKKRCMVETIWPGISEIRTTATRTGAYAGRDKTVFGPLVTETFKDNDGEVTVTFPEWAQITFYKLVQGQRCTFEGPVVYWKESYATRAHDSDVPNTMWATRPSGQLEKCTEAAGLRATFPEEVGNEIAAEEVGGRGFTSIGKTPEGVEILRPQARGATADTKKAEPPREAVVIDRAKLERVVVHGVEKKAGKAGKDTFTFWLVAYETEATGKKEAGTRDEQLAKVADGLKGDFALVAVEPLEKGALKLLHIEAAPAEEKPQDTKKAEGKPPTEGLFPQGAKDKPREPGEEG